LMDWALLARTTHAYVRPPQHEPDEGVTIIIDASTPMAFGDETSKLRWVAEWACWLSAWLASQHYRYDVLLWTPMTPESPWQHWRHYATHRSKQPPIQALVTWLYRQLKHAETQAWESTVPAACAWLPLASLQPALKPYRHAVVISDWSPHMNATDEAQSAHHWLDTLGPLCRRHRWHMVHVQHPMETTLSPQLVSLPLKALDTDGSVLLPALITPAQRQTFTAQQQQRQQTLTHAFQSAGFAMTALSTDASPLESLLPLLDWLR
jgi:uncharacterized protein (DUF58 family)